MVSLSKASKVWVKSWRRSEVFFFVLAIFDKSCKVIIYILKGALMNQEIQSSKPDNKQGLAIAGLVCGIIAFLFFPPLFGILGIVFGAISWKKGNKLGMAATIVSIAGLIIGMAIGAAVFTSNS